jgi:hypothetical protein
MGVLRPPRKNVAAPPRLKPVSSALDYANCPISRRYIDLYRLLPLHLIKARSPESPLCCKSVTIILEQPSKMDVDLEQLFHHHSLASRREAMGQDIC